MMTQAEDRCHRIGQANSVLVQHLVLDGSIDAAMAQTLVEKQEIIDKALDDDIPEKEIPVLPVKEPTTAKVSRKQVATEAEELTSEQIDAVHEGLKILAALDPDRAAQRNHMGFNAFDGKIGHELANVSKLTPRQAALGRRLVKKYHRQLGDELLRKIG